MTETADTTQPEQTPDTSSRRWSHALIALGLVAVAAGSILLAWPLETARALRWLIAAGIIIGAFVEFAAAKVSIWPALARARAVVWLAIGATIALFPGLTIRTLTLLLGVTLVATGAAELIAAIAGVGDDRLVLGLRGIVAVVVGIAALLWPSATVLVLVLVTGIRMIVFGIGQMAAGLRLRWLRAATVGEALTPQPTSPRWVRIVGVAGALVLAAGALSVAAAVRRAQPSEPDAFYTAPDVLPGGPGTIIRTQLIDPFRTGGTAYKVLYVSTDNADRPATASAIIVVPTTPARTGGRNIVAIAHGTVGVARNCAPSLLDGPTYAPALPGIDQFLAAGDVVAAPDYVGMGTSGVNAYLVGKAQAVAVLDSVRAVHNFAEAQAGSSFAVFGESQGGQASLFTGEYAATYAPELNLVGVAAAAPATNLVELFRANIGTTFGDVLAAYALTSWAKTYPGLSLADVVRPEAIPVIQRIAKNCIGAGLATISVIPDAEILKVAFLKGLPWELEPWKTILAQNTPGSRPTGAPILVVQGLSDPLVLPAVQRAFVDALCARGESVEYRELPEVGHLDAGQKSAEQVSAWIADRFAGTPATPTCA